MNNRINRLQHLAHAVCIVLVFQVSGLGAQSVWEGGDPINGQALFNINCASCHKVTDAVFEMRRQTPQHLFVDDEFLLENWLSPFGHLLRAHANYCMIRFMEVHKNPNMVKLHSTQDLINILIKFSRATLNEDTVLQMLPYEKDKLRNLIEDDKHHAVTAMNILMYFQRRGLLDIDNENYGG